MTKIRHSGALLLALCSALLTPLAAQAQAAPPTTRLGVYVVADDVDKTTAFYQRLFGKAPEIRLPTFVGFDINGGLYAVISRGAFAPNAKRGETVMPYIRVDDIDAWRAHVQAVAPGSLLEPHITREGPIALFKLRDPDGNLVEVYSLSR
ncbi:VOC family protein [Caulobacter mirabilis]|uniref:VOC domain-containing protein n=1 Tax=Caulobacter mirabilis TaxID=69666 RepID=A0A2D2AYE8_9CAUL|nr:VOC family protein [Caulobacter mirabilis]ATQ43036.1 hypothetical protein CSW64_11755 [Caulobacter mirabilis]